jgi:hypothetical protein
MLRGAESVLKEMERPLVVRIQTPADLESADGREAQVNNSKRKALAKLRFKTTRFEFLISLSEMPEAGGGY